MKALKLAVAALMLLSPSAFGGVIVYTAALAGTNESPPNASPGTGFAEVDVNPLAHTMRVMVTFSDLLAPNTASHIHCCTAVPGAGNASVATTTPTFTGFPSGFTSGSYDHTFDLTLASTYRAGFVTTSGSVANAEAILLAGLDAGTAYLNIHSTVFPGGEIRGFLQLQTPEPATFLLAGAALVGLVIRRRRK